MKKVQVKRGLAGLGLFAAEPIKRGEYIIEYFGEMIDSAEADRRGGKYLFALNKSWLIDGKSRKNFARYANHSCKPNALAELSEDEKQVFLKAKKKIHPGEEIAYHYGKQYFDIEIAPNGCKCPVCLRKASS